MVVLAKRVAAMLRREEGEEDEDEDELEVTLHPDLLDDDGEEQHEVDETAVCWLLHRSSNKKG